MENHSNQMRHTGIITDYTLFVVVFFFKFTLTTALYIIYLNINPSNLSNIKFERKSQSRNSKYLMLDNKQQAISLIYYLPKL